MTNENIELDDHELEKVSGGYTDEEQAILNSCPCSNPGEPDDHCIKCSKREYNNHTKRIICHITNNKSLSTRVN